jgi:predicted nucleic acid-binding protein
LLSPRSKPTAGSLAEIGLRSTSHEKTAYHLPDAPRLTVRVFTLPSTGRVEEEKVRVFTVLESLPFLPLDAESSKAGGRIYAEKKRIGSPVDPEDAMIAGIARVRGEKVLTKNLKHFQGIEGVKIEAY